MHSIFDISWWIWFNVGLFVLLALDVRYLRSNHTHSAAPPSAKKSILLTAAWVTLAMLFALLLYYTKGADPALTFLTGYVIEESLSVDNLFVFLLIFQSFHVPPRMQTKILMWGVLGALVMRLSLIFVGISLIQQAHFMILIFGAFLAITGIVMFKKPEKSVTPPKPFLVKLLQKCLPVTDDWENDAFLVRKSGKLYATPALVVLTTVEATDLLFALDSVPAVFAITLDPFIVYSCNALAILGLRSLFFVLKDLLEFFVYLHHGVSVILLFVGTKMLLSPVFEIPTMASLGVIGTILFVSLILSSIPHKKEKK